MSTSFATEAIDMVSCYFLHLLYNWLAYFNSVAYQPMIRAHLFYKCDVEYDSFKSEEIGMVSKNYGRLCDITELKKQARLYVCHSVCKSVDKLLALLGF